MHLGANSIHVWYIYIYIHTWIPNDPCFESKGPSFGGFKTKNRGQTGSRKKKYTYIYHRYHPHVGKYPSDMDPMG